MNDYVTRVTDFPNLLAMSGIYSGRAYTKSGSIEKYESNLWKGIVETTQDPATPAYPSQTPYLVAAPNANGNYQIAFRNTAPYVTFTAKTNYGGVIKTFSNTVTLPDITSGAISITGSIIEVEVNNLTKPISGNFIVSVPKNCSVDIQKDSCTAGIRIRDYGLVKNSDETSYTMYVVAEYAKLDNTLMCKAASVTVTVTANSNNTEFRPGSSAKMNHVVAVAM